MLENIKAIMFIRNTFSILTEKRILLIIKYNKSWQSKLRKSLINYKIFSGKYTIYETINNAKVYNAYDDKLLFEGEYLKGKRNGKGKEYDYDGKLLFEGEYLNGKRNGKGKEYYHSGKLKFEGEYLNNKRCLKFEGGFLNRKRNGNGKEHEKVFYEDSKLKIEVEYLNAKKYNGKVYKKNGIMDSKIKDGKQNNKNIIKIKI